MQRKNIVQNIPMPKVDLKAKPYNLSDEDIKWVKETISSMSIEEKIGQLFVNLFFFGSNAHTGNDLTSKEIQDKYHIGGARYQGGTSEQVQDLINELQSNAKVPLLVAANCDAGGNGACNDGTYVAKAALCEASDDIQVSYDAGYVSGREENALGVNWNFDPCVDILKNWRNTIVNTRSYGTKAETVIKHTNCYIKGLRESNIGVCIKHWPGDGVEERDQHLLMGINDLSVEEWEESFGKVYRTHIENGVHSIMAGHIALPEYQKVLVPGLEDHDILPATLAPELINGLLKGKLGFNGLVITDASHMIGMAAAMPREQQVPQAIAAGCDMYLFFNDIEEDFNFMLNGYKNGIITEERLQDALERILGLKASIGLHKAQKEGALLRTRDDLAVIGCEDHIRRAKAAADNGITLVKNTLDQLPIRPDTHKRIRLYYLEGEKGGIYEANSKTLTFIIAELERRGFEVTVNDGTTRVRGNITKYQEETDAALVFANIVGYAAENNYRIRWKGPMSTDVPWYVYEVPTVFVSLNFTTHLTDVPMVKAYINAYNDDEITISQTIDKIMGESEFNGTPNELVWCEKWDTRL
ncbi:glycoside hydrolase family 3 N-terminal domain-containing protein [Neobacillus sp. PS3-12]|uniref:glycoside hydrolase family 3 protein n=1 Tax=Neobacillus sp. PS3-12 TaxID=3070677 RepID=UPI0027DEB813|nr:glycoside hydrolase family 3 N-terminal domain-containing protein [Neobacillus sp. PS3-12]WML54459.1 glycoside hydrolase family 3 N-terminal domain-containing protein [Neobacillus sp. PS3-12]